VDSNSGAGVDLSGIAFNQISIAMAPVTSAGTVGSFTTLTGAATAFTDVVNGKFTYKFSAADVATAGNYQLVIVVNYGAGDIMRSLPLAFTIVRTV
ncbi:MAG: hypothetical protein ACXWP0_10970, partial [Ktedonobacterales bacterium]